MAVASVRDDKRMYPALKPAPTVGAVGPATVKRKNRSPAYRAIALQAGAEHNM